ncbi:MAG TPA: hypothetical protein VL098_13055 [Flavipsychrobacter sp.]|nr:hypothetical protein [Flavipsychrobacter sp.]
MCKVLFAFIPLLLGMVLYAHAQEKQTAIVTGRLLNESTGDRASDVQVTIPYLRILAITDGNGEFTFSDVPFGTQRLVIGGSSVLPDTITIHIDRPVVNLGELNVSYNEAALSPQTTQIPFIVLDDNDENDDENAGTQAVSSLLTASRDPFLNTAAFIFGPYRFQPRGYDRNQQQVLINGAPMNDVETGDAYWSQWGGLNDVFRSRSNTYGLQFSEYAFGDINGTTAFDATAASQRKQTRITYSIANRQYRNRLMLTHSSGLNKNGWGYSLSFSKRWAEEGYIPGTFYDGYSYYAAITKRIKGKHDLNLTAFGAPTKRGKQAPSFRESYDILGTNFYNPNWGYYNGKVRNAKVANIHQPVILLNYEHNPSSSMQWNTTVGYQFGKNRNSTLDWYNAYDPRPDYYQKLPSYTINNDKYPNLTTEEVSQLSQAFIKNSQINWDELYYTNKINRTYIPNQDGSLSIQKGLRSLYVIGEDVDDVKKWIFNTQLQKSLNEHITVHGGLSLLKQNTESYRELSDLLGGEFFLNVNSFVERNFAGSSVENQNDLNHPYQLLHEGDRYNYHYKVDFLKSWLWAQAVFTYNKADFFIGANYGVNTFQREGLFRNGLFADESYGKGERLTFNTYGIKGGLTYKINGRHYLFVNAGYAADAPTVDNTYFSARVRNATVTDPKVQITSSVEGGYLLRAPKTNIRLAAYATDRKDAVEVQRLFYQGTGSSNSMAAYVMEGVNTRYTGIEAAVEYKLSSTLSATAVAAVGQAFYTSNPKATLQLENNIALIPFSETTYMNNKYLGVGPQSAYTLGLNYRSKQYWYLSANFNYFDRIYIDPAAPRRTEQAVEMIEPGSAQWHSILDQEQLPSFYTVDVFGGKSFLLSKISKSLPKNTYLYFNVGINNLLNNKSIGTGGFESVRFNYEGSDASKFASKYFYGFGRNYFINLSLKF